MRKTVISIFILITAVSILYAEDIDISARIGLELFDENMGNSIYKEDVPGIQIGSSYLQNDLQLSAGGLLINSKDIERRYLEGEITADERESIMETAPRWEFETDIDLLDMLRFKKEENVESATNLDNNYYNLLQPMIDWYENKRFEYGLIKRAWPTTIYGGESGRTQFIYESTVINIEDVTWDAEKWVDARMLFTQLKTQIETQINTISPDIDIESDDNNPVQFTDLSGSALDAAKLEKKAWDDYSNFVYGSKSSASLLGPLKNTSLRFLNVFSVLDIEIMFQTSKLQLGNEIISSRAAHKKDGFGVKLGATDLLFPGIDAELLFQVSEGESSVAEDWTTMVIEEYDGESGEIGLLANLNMGFRTRARKFNISYNIGLEGGVLDFYYPFNFAASLSPIICMDIPLASPFFNNYYADGSVNFGLNIEANLLGYENRYIEDDEIIAYASAIEFNANWLGLQPVVRYRYKSEGYGGDGSGNLAEDRFTGKSLDDDFNNTNISSAMAIEAGLNLSAMPLIQRDINIYFNYQRMLTGEKRAGWNAGLSMDLQNSSWLPGSDDGVSFMDFIVYDLLTIPLSASIEVSKYGEELMELSGRLGYYPSEGIELYMRAGVLNNDWSRQEIACAFGTVVNL